MQKNKIDFEKKKNVTINKRRTKITSRCKICGKRFLKRIANDEHYRKVRESLAL